MMKSTFNVIYTLTTIKNENKKKKKEDTSAK